MKIFTFKSVYLMLALFASSLSYASNIEQDFTGAWNPALPTKAVTTYTEHTSPAGTTWGLFNGKLNTYGGATNLYLTKSNGYLVLPAVDFKVGSIEITSGDGSISPTAEMALYVGTVNGGNIEWAEDPIDSKITALPSTPYLFILANQVKGSVYKLAASNAKNLQIKAVKIIEATADPALSFQDNSDLHFGTGLNGTLTKKVNVIGSNLLGNITASIEGPNADKFSIDNTNLGLLGGEVAVTYTNPSAGQANATLKVTSGILSQTLNLAATTVERAGSKEDPLTVSDVLALNNTTEGMYWLKGTIAGCATTISDANPSGIDAETVASNIALKEANVTATVPVELPAQSDVRTSLSLVTNPGNLNKEVLVYGNLILYFGRTGLKGTSDYVLDGSSSIKANQSDALASIYRANGVVYVPTTAGETIIVSNVAGQIIRSIHAQEEVTPIENLPANQILFINVNGKIAKVAL